MSRFRLAAAFAIAVTLVSSPTGAFDWNDVDVNKVASGGSKLFRGAVGLNEAEELQLGREVAANLAARYSVIDDPVKSEYVNLIAQTLARHSGRPALNYRVAILRSAEVNAFAAPGGYLFLTDGLLNTLQDESELAGVLAHEMSHVTHKHILKALQKANVLGGGKELMEAGGVNVNAYAPLADFSITMLDQGLSRGDELDADRAGTTLAATCGYDPTGLRRSIERLGTQEKTNLFISRFAKTHPPTATRLVAIDKVLKKNHYGKGERLSDRFRNRLAQKSL